MTSALEAKAKVTPTPEQNCVSDKGFEVNKVLKMSPNYLCHGSLTGPGGGRGPCPSQHRKGCFSQPPTMIPTVCLGCTSPW